METLGSNIYLLKDRPLKHTDKIQKPTDLHRSQDPDTQLKPVFNPHH